MELIIKKTMLGLKQSVKLKIKTVSYLLENQWDFFLSYFFFTIIKNSYSINWTKEFNGISFSEKINLSNRGTISHYKNFGYWKVSLGNYGTQKCYGTILIMPS